MESCVFKGWRQRRPGGAVETCGMGGTSWGG